MQGKVCCLSHPCLQLLARPEETRVLPRKLFLPFSSFSLGLPCRWWGRQVSVFFVNPLHSCSCLSTPIHSCSLEKEGGSLITTWVAPPPSHEAGRSMTSPPGRAAHSQFGSASHRTRLTSVELHVDSSFCLFFPPPLLKKTVPAPRQDRIDCSRKQVGWSHQRNLATAGTSPRNPHAVRRRSPSSERKRRVPQPDRAAQGACCRAGKALRVQSSRKSRTCLATQVRRRHVDEAWDQHGHVTGR